MSPLPPLPPDPLDAVPVLDPQVESRQDARHRLQLRRVYAARRGLGGVMARVTGQRFAKRLVLDERGTFFIQQMDGRTTLRDIAARMASRFQLDAEPCRDATLTFAGQLMKRRMLCLLVREGASHG